MTDAVILNIITAASGILGAIVGGAFTVKAAIKAVEKTSEDLESTEIRRQKVECIVALHGLRWVVSKEQDQFITYRADFITELNRVQSLWADDLEVMKNLRDFYAQPGDDRRLFLLLRTLGGTTKLQTDRLSDADLRNIFTINVEQTLK
jgi:hypothetical protein